LDTGNIGGMYIDSKDHIWVFHRPGTTTGNSERYGLTGEGECCLPAPPVLEFDLAGNLLQAWGPIHEPNGQLVGKQVWGPFPDVEWPRSEHGIFVDYKDNVWLSSEAEPSQILKLTRDAKFLMRIGKEQGKSSNETTNLGGPAGLVVDPKTNELYVADGYKNRRVIVFDADTGVYKRHWGAYGKRPADGLSMARRADRLSRSRSPSPSSSGSFTAWRKARTVSCTCATAAITGFRCFEPMAHLSKRT
jgi:hypothetical protein